MMKKINLLFLYRHIYMCTQKKILEKTETNKNPNIET